MRKLFLLLFSALCFVFSVQAQHPDPNVNEVEIPQLIFTEFQFLWTHQYIEMTNVGDDPIALSDFAIVNILNQNPTGFDPATRYVGTGLTAYPGDRVKRFEEGDTIQPGESRVIMRVMDLAVGGDYPKRTQHPDKLVPLADYYSHYDGEVETDETKFVNIPEYKAYDFDSVSVDSRLLHWTWLTYVLMYNYEREYYDAALDSTYMLADSLIADCFNLQPKPSGTQFGGSTAIAGVEDANNPWDHLIARKADVTQGTADWPTSRGVSPEDSEWMVVPNRTTMEREPFTSVGTHDNFMLDITPNAGYSINGNVITVPWEAQREDELILKGFQLGDGMTWYYNRSPETADSAFRRVRLGDTVTFYAFGNELSSQTFSFDVSEPSADLAIAIPKIGKNDDGYYNYSPWVFMTNENGEEMDSIWNIPYQTTYDTLFAYLDIPPDATAEIVPVDEDLKRIELKDMDILKVRSKDGSATKEYLVRVEDYEPSDNSYLSVISFPDYSQDPNDYYWNWADLRADTIPDFAPTKFSYVLKVSADRVTVPALVVKPQNMNATVNQTPAVNLTGSAAERTTTFVVTSESGEYSETYTITFVKDVNPELVQPVTGDAFITDIVKGVQNTDSYLEFYNPTSEPMDMSDYILVVVLSTETPEAALLAPFNETVTIPDMGDMRRSVLPGSVLDTARWAKGERGYFIEDPAVNTIVPPGEVFVSGICDENGVNEMAIIDQVDQNMFNQAIKDANGPAYPWHHGGGLSWNQGLALFKMSNDSVRKGLKAINEDLNDYTLVDYFRQDQELIDAGNQIVAGYPLTGRALVLQRKSRVQQGVTEPGRPHVSPDADTCDWIPRHLWKIAGTTPTTCRDNVGRHDMDPVTSQSSTISSSVYIVTPGYQGDLNIRGIVPSTTVSDFLDNLTKADEEQNWEVHNGDVIKTDDTQLAEGDSITVASADSSSFSTYELLIGELSGDVSLSVVSGFDLVINDDNSVSGFGYDEMIADILAGVECNPLSYINVVDEDKNLVPLLNVRFLNELDEEDELQTEIVETGVFDGLMFEVVAENGTRAYYPLAPESDELMILSNYYTVNHDSTYIKGIPEGTSVTTLLSYLSATHNATVEVYDTLGYLRTDGLVKWNDYAQASTEDGDSVQYYVTLIGRTPQIPEKVGVGVETQYELKGRFSAVYPNPASNQVTIENAPTGSVLQIISLSGRVVHTRKVTQDLITIPVNHYDSGMYFIRIVEKEGSTVHRLVIQ